MNRLTIMSYVKYAVIGSSARRTVSLVGSWLLFGCCLVPRAGATVYTLNPGDFVTSASSSYPTSVSGTPVGQDVAPFTFGTLSGTLTSTVYSDDSSNPYIGGYTFTYLLQLNGSSSSSGFTVGGFAGYLTDVSYNKTGVEIAPSNFLRSGNGDVVHPEWNSPELPFGDTGALVVVQTDATTFSVDTGTITDSTGGTVSVLSPVPEPGVASLLAVGFGALLVRRRRSH